tara:strand:+ start:266 stop:568 length:303 start_codon:yes stop_codon:yes gene_type:complete
VEEGEAEIMAVVQAVAVLSMEQVRLLALQHIPLLWELVVAHKLLEVIPLGILLLQKVEALVERILQLAELAEMEVAEDTEIQPVVWVALQTKMITLEQLT